MEMDEIRGHAYNGKGPTIEHVNKQGDPESPSTDSYQRAAVQAGPDAPEPRVSLSTILAVFVSQFS